MAETYIIKYRDGENIYNFREEVLDDEDCVIDYGETITFSTKEKAQEYLNTLDSREFDRWVEVKK
tara:strand:- start:418 stop:612 length:195 start_codon:yes stop_codon:yes gene_type:complete